MDLIIQPGFPLRGEITLPGDKSLSHRAALFTALAEGKSRIDNFLVAGVTRAMLNALSALGVSWELHVARLEINGQGLGGLYPPAEPLQCGNSATTMRLLAGALAAAGVPAILDGSPGLQARPMRRIVEPLKAMGVPIETAPGGRAPLVLRDRPRNNPLKSITYELPVPSAQVKTALLLAGLAANGPTTLIEPGPSRDHTERLLANMGVGISTHPLTNNGYPLSITLNPPRHALRPLNFQLPGDISSAAFLIVAALITPGSQIVLREVGINPTRIGLLEVLESMGGNIQISERGHRHGEPVGDLKITYSRLQGVKVKGQLVLRMIDEFPAFAIAAAFASGPTVINDAEELRYKESDRISALCRGLSSLGVAVREFADGFELLGKGVPYGGSVQSFGDHRLAMSFALAGLVAGHPVTVQDAEVIKESFPSYVETFQALGANIRLEN